MGEVVVRTCLLQHLSVSARQVIHHRRSYFDPARPWPKRWRRQDQGRSQVPTKDLRMWWSRRVPPPRPVR